MAKTRKGTCDGCGMVRKLTYPEPPDFKNAIGQPRRPLNSEEFKQDISYYGLCSECFPKVKTQDDIGALRRIRPKKQRSKLAYPVIGGPLDGQHAITDDFHRDGIYEHLRREYNEFNAAGSGNKRIGGSPTMVFIHKSLLKPIISGKDR